jgi:enoyl-CoA hydratase
MTYENIQVRTEGKVGIITLNRPQALNALSSALMDELSEAITGFDGDDQVRCMIITGSEKAFAAGADITEMSGKSFVEAYRQDFITRNWEEVTRARKPVIAAVAGFALGGGCELAMMCDIIIAADNAKFGQPEINLGIGPGAGGTQRLTRAIGKAKAMDLCLTGRMMDAGEAERSGLVARVVPLAQLMTEAMTCAQKIAGASLASAMMIKESINAAFETTLSHGVRLERRLFHAMFATEDQKEGMAAFVEKRKPAFKDR